MSKIVVAGYHGYENAGDDATLITIINNIRNIDAKTKIVVLSANPKLTSSDYNVRSIYRFNLFKVVWNMISAKALVLGGGTLIQDSTSKRSNSYYLGLIQIAKLFNKKVMLYSNGLGPLSESSRKKTAKILNKVDIISLRENYAKELLDEKKEIFPENIYHEFLKVVVLRVVDTYWTEHIDAMSELRQAVRLQSYAQVNPLREYQEVGFEKFDTMIMNIENDVTKFINRAQVQNNLQREAVVKDAHASSGKEEATKRKPVVKKQQEPGRNDPCPCGSGKKYKNCCGKL